MHQEHAEMIVAVSPAPGWGLCVIDGHLPRVLRGLAPSELPLRAGMWKQTPVSQRRTFLHRAGVNNWSLPRLNILMRRKWFVNGFCGHFSDLYSQVERISRSLFFFFLDWRKVCFEPRAQLEPADGNINSQCLPSALIPELSEHVSFLLPFPFLCLVFMIHIPTVWALR